MKKPLPKRYWIEDSIRVVALECESKSDLRLKFPGAYSAGRKLGILDSLEFKPKSPNIDRANEAVHLIYVYLDNENNVAYVGATLNIKKRHYQHKNSKDKVYKYFDSVNKEVPEPIILKCGLLPIDRQIEERTFSLFYIENGYKLLNDIRLTGEGIGSLGGVIFKWSREEVIRVAKTFATITDFMVHESGAYDAAKKFGLLNMQDMPWFFENRKPFGWWNEKEHVFSESRKYKTWHEFEVGSPAAHFSARKHKWVKEMDWLQNDQVPNGYWMNEENVILESTNYTNRTDFKRGCSAGYNYANEHNLWDKMPWIELKTEQRGTWNIKENVFREAKKYRTKVEFKRGCSSAYYAALRNGWIDEMTWFIKESKPRGFWQIKENVIIESKKYKSRVEFRRGNPSAYGHAVKNGWINEMTWLTRPKNYNLKWTKEKVFDVARNFNTRGALKKKYPGVYSAARSHNWFKEMDWMK